VKQRKPKRRALVHRDPVARTLADPHYQPRTVPMKTLYDRKAGRKPVRLDEHTSLAA
jgi:hypothetical protein